MKKVAITIVVILFAWLLLTLWVERTGVPASWRLGAGNSNKTALIIYDPDPLYNLDEQVCKAFANVLSEHDFEVTIATVAFAKELKDSYSLYIFCANTYNWRPDWAISSFVKDATFLENKPVVAITLGAGSTVASQKAFERIILAKKANLIDSRSLWLLRPNHEGRLDESNISVAISQINNWAKEIAKQFHGYDTEAE